MSEAVQIMIEDSQKEGVGLAGDGADFLFLSFPTSALERMAGGGLAVYLSGTLPTGAGTETSP